MVLSQEELNHSEVKEINSELPCLDSSNKCVEQLTERAIASSVKLKTLNSRIALIDERLELMGDRKDYAESKLWTNYLPTSTGSSVIDIVNPFAWIKNIAGGGDMQRDRLAIADLEIKAATLEAARAELETKLESEKLALKEKVIELVIEVEESDRSISLIQSQIETFELQQQVFRIKYAQGGGSTSQFLSMEDKKERLNDKLLDAQNDYFKAIRELGQVTGYEEMLMK